ncbi:hypothetical protein HX109_02325 [Galbibacter sp. BG1]|uniref:hypothetical protein n=1 Tax=Galbibacter sp. BG1 TaxID=1170699 RepID=UPI0015C025F3|nr:hypothetical protein [Galbibacter sp. BG1]QLE00451.1 hypothetical protein HX109_02325 [Galbibacter sp. BG1]
MKTLFKFFILVSILCLSGLTHVFAHAATNNFHYSSLENYITSQNTGFNVSVSDRDLDFKTITTAQGTSHHRLELTETEIVEEEFISHGKEIIETNFFSSLLLIQILSSFIENNGKRLDAARRFLNISSCKKFIIFRVIRL